MDEIPLIAFAGSMLGIAVLALCAAVWTNL